MLGHIRLAEIFAVNRALLAVAAVTLSIPSHGQQEIDPTWYNPWPQTSKTVVHRPQPGPAANHKKQAKITTATNSPTRKHEPRAPGPRDRQHPNQLATTKSPSPR
jgi:hypothetical protein